MADYGMFEYGTKLPLHVYPITCSVVLEQRLDANRLLLQYKARIVPHEFWQLAGYDYHESSASLIELHFLRLLLSTIVANNVDNSHVDVKTAFPTIILEEEIRLVLQAVLWRDTATEKIIIIINAPADDVLQLRRSL